MASRYTNCLIAVLNNRKQTSTGTALNDISSGQDSGRSQYFSGTGRSSKSVPELNNSTKVQIVRNVDLRVDSSEDIELGELHPSKVRLVWRLRKVIFD